MGSNGFGRLVVGAGVALLLAACSPQDTLAPTPTIYLTPGAKPIIDARTGGNDDLSLVYVTDRAPIADPETGALSYGADRSRFISFGSVDVRISQPQVASASSSGGELKVGAVSEVGRFPQEPYAALLTPRGYRRAPEVVAAHQQAVAALQAEIRKRIAGTRRKEVVVFIHGYNNTFKDAVTATGNICHFLGDDFVCVVLTWPAGGSKGVLMGYNVDRESSEFAVTHVKKAIRAIGETEGVRGVHIIAHSRGTDVLASAFQQLGIEAYVSRSSVAEQLKVKNVVLFAPDIDIDVASTKLFGIVSDPDAHFGAKKNPNGLIPSQGALHATIYSSPDDRALGLASALFGSEMRLGQQDLYRADTKTLGHDPGRSGLVDFIQVNGKTDATGHGYFLSNPAVSSDLVALIRYGLEPGAPGRPLVEINRPYWRVASAAASSQ